MIQPRPPRETTLPVQLPSKGALARTAVIGGAGVVLAAGAAVALFHVAVTIVTGLAIVVALVATVTMLPALQLAFAAGRTKAMEGVARALPLETLIQNRDQFAKIISDREQDIARAGGFLRDLEATIAQNRAALGEEEYAAEMADLERSREAFTQARERLEDLRTDIAEFDTTITRARIKLRLGEAKGNIAQSLGDANLSAEQRHITESALSEINRRAGENAERLKQALDGAQRRPLSGAGRA